MRPFFLSTTVKISFVLLLLASCIHAQPIEEWYEQCEDGLNHTDFSRVVTIAKNALDVLPEDSLAPRSEFNYYLAMAYCRMGMFEEALMHAGYSLSLDEEIGEPLDISSSLNNMAAILIYLNQYATAEDYLNRTIALEREFAQDTRALAIRLAMLGEVYSKQDRGQEALDSTYLAYTLDSIAGREGEMGIRMSQLAAVHYTQHNYDLANELLQKSMPILQKYDNYTSLTISYILLSRVYKAIGDVKEAEEAAMEAQKMARQYSLRIPLLNSLLALSEVSVAPADKYDYLKQAYDLKDLIFNESVGQRIAHFTTEYHLAEQERKLYEQQMLLDRVQWNRAVLLMIVVVLLLLVIIMFALLRIRVHMRNRQRLEQASFALFKQEQASLPKQSEPVMPVSPEQDSPAQDVSADSEEKDEAKDEAEALPDLSEREKEVLRLCCEGLSSKQIADNLCLSSRTVEGYKSAIFAKLGVNTTVELVLYALRHKLIR